MKIVILVLITIILLLFCCGRWLRKFEWITVPSWMLVLRSTFDPRFHYHRQKTPCVNLNEVFKQKYPDRYLGGFVNPEVIGMKGTTSIFRCHDDDDTNIKNPWFWAVFMSGTIEPYPGPAPLSNVFINCVGSDQKERENKR